LPSLATRKFHRGFFPFKIVSGLHHLRWLLLEDIGLTLKD
jgi:hypothetical protein